MKKILMRKIRQNKAFTLIETLIVIAVMVVLMGVGTIGLTEFAATTKMTELDNYAKTIYLEAQNQMTAAKAEGGNHVFYTELKTKNAARFLENIGMPADYHGTNPDAWKEFAYLTKADEITKELIFVEADAYEGEYILEISAQTGDIYGVFCWNAEKDAEIDSTYYENYYEEVIAKLTSRDKEARKDLKLGYYGGGLIATKNTTEFVLDQKVEIINEEELYVKVSFPHSPLLETNPDSWEITCVIKGENGDMVEIPLPAPENNGRYMESYLLLDSMHEGFDIATITGGKFKPGENLDISVVTKYKSDTHFAREESPTHTVNTSFAGKTVTDAGETVVAINSVRHLKNLNDGINSWDENSKSYVNDGAFRIQLQDNIDFGTNEYAWGMKDGEMQYLGETKATAPENAAKWTPITNQQILNNTGSATDKTIIESAGDNTYVLKNFDVQASDAGTGIFASANNVEFRDIWIEDITVNASGKENVGALVGSVQNGIVDNCGVYLSTSTRNEDGTKVYHDDMDARQDKYDITGGTNVGGLIGKSDDTEITNSFAAINTKGTSNVGGLIGTVQNNTTITNSYSSGDVTASGNNAGGFVGNASSSTVTDCYSTSDVFGTNVFAGFVGTSNTVTYTDCSSYGEVLTTADAKPTGKTTGGFVASNSGNTFTDCNYLTQSDYNDTGFSNSSVSSKSYSDFMNAATGESLSVGARYPYSKALQYDTFPFEKVLDHHFGDWPLEAKSEIEDTTPEEETPTEEETIPGTVPEGGEGAFQIGTMGTKDGYDIHLLEDGTYYIEFTLPEYVDVDNVYVRCAIPALKSEDGWRTGQQMLLEFKSGGSCSLEYSLSTANQKIAYSGFEKGTKYALYISGVDEVNLEDGDSGSNSRKLSWSIKPIQ